MKYFLMCMVFTSIAWAGDDVTEMVYIASGIKKGKCETGQNYALCSFPNGEIEKREVVLKRENLDELGNEYWRGQWQGELNDPDLVRDARIHITKSVVVLDGKKRVNYWVSALILDPAKKEGVIFPEAELSVYVDSLDRLNLISFKGPAAVIDKKTSVFAVLSFGPVPN